MVFEKNQKGHGILGMWLLDRELKTAKLSHLGKTSSNRFV
jgi:hypothetical protein